MTSADPPPDEIQPLEYHTPDPPRRAGPLVAGGVVVAILAWGFAGFVATLSVLNYTLNAFARTRQPNPGASYAVGFLSATMIAVVILAALPRERRRRFLLGFLLGTAVMGLIEGICFLNQ